jgi:excisionase family DNA binding protein
MKAKESPPKQIAVRRGMSITEAAETLGVSHWTVRRLIKSGAIRSCRILRTHIIPVNEIDRLLDNTEPQK